MLISQVDFKALKCGPCGTTRAKCRVRGIIGCDKYSLPADWDIAHLRATRALDPTVCVNCGRTRPTRGGRCGWCTENTLPLPVN
jgi:hypothetical protein